MKLQQRPVHKVNNVLSSFADLKMYLILN
jgi:hypothetical protein